MEHVGVTVLRLKPIAPTLTNLNGATNVSATGARLNGEITGSGGENPAVTIYWGPTDGGTTASSWLHAEQLGQKPMGTFYKDIVGLTTGTTYYYRCYASNSGGSVWSTSTASFVAGHLPTMEDITPASGGYYRTAPALTNLGFDDTDGLNGAWFQIDSCSADGWTSFGTVSGKSWDDNDWTVPGFAGLTQGIHTVYFKASNTLGGVEGENGEWKWQFYKDTEGPTGPSSLHSDNNTLRQWSSDNTVSVSFTAAADELSGLDGYGFLFDTIPTTDPDTKILNANATEAVGPALPDGADYWFHIRPVDVLGNWGATVHWGPLWIETVPPSAVTDLSSTSHPLGTWSNSSSISANWTPAMDATSGIAGYSIVWDTSPTTEAPIRKTADNVTSCLSPTLADGDSHWVHIRAVDRAGNWSAVTAHLGPFWVDTTAPSGPAALASGNHTAGVWSSDNVVTVTWVAADGGASGLAGYSVCWDQSNATVPDDIIDIAPATTNVTSPELADGIYYFHIRARDVAGNWGKPITAGPFQIDRYSPLLSDGRVSPTGGYQSATYTFEVRYEHPLGLAPSFVGISIDGSASSNMTLVAGQTDNFSEPHTYRLAVAGSSLTQGTHSFAFAATDNESHHALGDTGQKSGPTISSPPPAPIMGGGGGGGGGAPVTGPGETNLALYTNAEGLFNIAAIAKSEDSTVTVTFPRGATARTSDGSALKKIKIAPLDNVPAPNPGHFAIGKAYEISPEGATFDPSVDLVFSYDPNNLPPKLDLSTLVLAVYDPSASRWIPLESTLDRSSSTVRTSISHLSIYGLFGKEDVPPPAPPPEPAKFSVTAIGVDPSSCTLGEPVTVSATVKNEGGLSGEFEAVLKVNGNVEATRRLTVGPGASTTVQFTVASNQAGLCAVEINGKAATFTVREPLPTSTAAPEESEVAQPAPANSVSWLPWLLFLAGLVVAGGGGILIWSRSRRKA